MKKLLIFVFAISIVNILYAQEKPTPEPLQYPFDEISTESSRGVFGQDDRKEVKDAEGIADFVRATAVMIPKENIVGNKVFGETLRELLTKQFGTSNFDPNVKFLDQPTCAYCTGFLIAPDILVTAGHCFKTLEDAKKYVWVFDYTNELKHNSYIGYVEVNPNDVYEVQEILGAEFSSTINTNEDYSFLRLKRKSERKPYRFRTSGGVSLFNDVTMIGSPTGLPLKVVQNSYVIDTKPKEWFKNSLDGFPGNSGGPVFNNNGFIEGIHVRGAAQYTNGRYTSDYKYDLSCNCIKTVEFMFTIGTAGSQAHRINSVPPELLQMAIYENLEFAIQSKDLNRLNDWLTYKWMLNSDYTLNRGKLEVLAAKQNNFEALQTLMEKVDQKFEEIEEQLMVRYAINKKNYEMLDFLLANGFSVDGNSSTETHLQYAINNYYSWPIDILIDYGANINLKYSNGDNLLHIAARKGDMSLSQKLIKAGVNPKEKNNMGYYPEKVAKKANYKEISKYLKKARRGKL